MNDLGETVRVSDRSRFPIIEHSTIRTIFSHLHMIILCSTTCIVRFRISFSSNRTEQFIWSSKLDRDDLVDVSDPSDIVMEDGTGCPAVRGVLNS